MKVLLINGSPKAERCTFTALSEVAKTLEAEGIETEIVHIGNQAIRGCIDCRACKKNGKCVFNDIVNEVAPKFAECDGLVVGTPVYYASANGNLISFLDRLFFSTPFDKSMKVALPLYPHAAAAALPPLTNLTNTSPLSHAGCLQPVLEQRTRFTPEDVRKDEEGLQTMRTLGKNMAFLIKSIALGKEKYGLPEREPQILTNFID